MVVAKDLFVAVGCVVLLGRIDEKSGVIVGFQLAALDVLQPAVVDDVLDADTLLRIRVQHL